MFRLSGLFSILFAVGLGILLFLTSQSVQKAEHKLSKIEQSNQAEQETLRVLSAEWDYLNRPERLEQLTRYNLDLDATHADQKSFVSTIEEVPEPIAPVIPKIKPDFLQHVSTKPPVRKDDKIIENNHRDNFDQLLNGLSDGGQP